MRDQLDTASVDALAADLHATQTDKSGVAYIEHPRAVARGVAFLGEVAEQAALLHDAVEDTRATRESLLEAGVNPVVVRAVLRVTRPEGEGRPTYRVMIEQIADLDTYTEPGDFVPGAVLADLGLPTDLRVPIAACVKVADNAHNSDPRRQVVLKQDVSEGLLRRYANARRVLLGAVPPEVARRIFQTLNLNLLSEVQDSAT